MLAHESTYCLSVPGGNAEVSLNGLRAILGQVEAELYQSEIYGQMLSSLQALPGELNKQVQCMVRAVGREAIRLALRKVVRKKSSVVMHSVSQEFTASPLKTCTPRILPPPPPTASPNRAVSSEPDADLNMTTAKAIAPAVNDAPKPTNQRVILYPPTSSPTTKQLPINARKKPSKKELAAQAMLQAREERLREVGQVIRQVRQERSWSLYHLHLKTQIPTHQLEALETGCIERLPEDIYLRGFIRQAGNALGLDGQQMANSLPAIASATNVLPSWQQPKAQSGLHLNSMHIYLGYAAVMASGIAWVSHQSAPTADRPSVAPSVTVTPQPQQVPTHTSDATSQKRALTPAKKLVSGSNKAMQNIAPPEASPL